MLTIPICLSMLKILLLAPDSYNFEVTSFSTPKTIPSFPRIPIAVLQKRTGHGKCFKISNTNCLQKRPRQTAQTQIRLLLKKQSDQGLHCFIVCYSDKRLVNSALKTNVLFENRKKKDLSVRNCRRFIVNLSKQGNMNRRKCQNHRHFYSTKREKHLTQTKLTGLIPLS